MVFEWTPHRFSGGLLALDLVNTIVCRSDPARRADRLEPAENINGFARAAAVFRADELGEVVLSPVVEPHERVALIALREAVNDWARPLASGSQDSGQALSMLFAAAARCARRGGTSAGLTLGAAAAISAMRLLDPKTMARTKVCPNCDWLFIDRSKNRSRLWCDMAVCGNRAKARTHYRRRGGLEPKREHRT